MDCRGQGGSSEDTGGVKGNTYQGHIIRGLDDRPEQLLFRQIFLDTVQMARVIISLPEVDENRVATNGASQGGALSLACAALEPRIRKTVAVYPDFGHEGLPEFNDTAMVMAYAKFLYAWLNARLHLFVL